MSSRAVSFPALAGLAICALGCNPNVTVGQESPTFGTGTGTEGSGSGTAGSDPDTGGGSNSDTGGGSNSDTSGGSNSDTGGGSNSDTGGASTTADTDSGPKFDLPVPDSPGAGGAPCKKVDLLFMVDNSDSMQPKQSNLIANFPAFISGMQSALINVDSYHVGVVTSEPNEGNPEPCRQTGDLVTGTSGRDSSNQPCGPGATHTYAEGFRYMTEIDDLPATFSCAAQVGTAAPGHEAQAGAVIAALELARNEVGGCNESFSRSDALLVVVIITDEEDEYTRPHLDYRRWFDALVAAKSGIETNIAMLSILTYSTIGGSFGATLGPLTERFTHHKLADINGDYGPAFEDLLSVIATACEDFTPPQ